MAIMPTAVIRLLTYDDPHLHASSVTWASFQDAFTSAYPGAWGRDAFYAWDELHSRAVLADEIDEDPS